MNETEILNALKPEKKNDFECAESEFVRYIKSSRIGGSIVGLVKWYSKNAVTITATAGLIAFITTTWLQWHSFEQTIESSNKTTRIILIKDIYRDFIHTDNFLKIEKSIVEREQLYKGRENTLGGKYTWQELNEYLGFYEQLYFLHDEYEIKLSTIDFYFGAAIIEAYLSEEIRDYVLSLRSVIGGHPNAFTGFQKIAESLSQLSSNKLHVDTYKNTFEKWN